MYRDADVSAIEAAWAARDGAQLAEIGSRVGVALEPSALARLNALLHRAGTGVRRRDVIATMLNAATGETGISMYEWERWLCLAVRHAARVTVGFARGTKVSKIWPDLKPWQSHYPSNRKRLDPWAETEADDRVSFGVIAIATPQPKTPPNAEELIAQIVENPHDRASRAVLADLLIEHDHVRGKLMRLQNEIDALPLQSEDRKKRELVVAQLVKQHGRLLAGEIADFASEYTFAGGFVDIATMTAAAFRDHGERLFAQQPIRQLKLDRVNSTAIATLAKSNVGFIRELLVDARREVALTPLGGPRFDRLEVLEIHIAHAIDDEVFLAWLHAPRLRSLVLRAPIQPTTLRGLAQNRLVCDRLEELVIRPAWGHMLVRLRDEDTIADTAFRELALPKLRRLDIAYCAFASPRRIAMLRERAPVLTDVEVEV